MLKLSNQIINGDCLKEIKKIPDKTFDLVFADPPYNMQIGEKLTRPDASKVNGVNDKWDKFNITCFIYQRLIKTSFSINAYYLTSHTSI